MTATPPAPPTRHELARWIGIVPVAVLCFLGSVLLGFGLDTLMMRWCPPDSAVSGICTASWWPPAHRAMVVFCAGVAGFACVLVPSAMAPMPSRRPYVALMLLMIGGFAAVDMALQTRAYPEAVAAIVGGALAWLLVRAWLTRDVFVTR